MATASTAEATRTEGRIQLRSGVWLWSLVPQGAGRAAVLHLVADDSPEDELHVELGRRVTAMSEAEVAAAARFATERVWAGPGGRQWKLTDVPHASPRMLEFQCDGIALRVPDTAGQPERGLGDLLTAEIADLLGSALVAAAADGAALSASPLPWTARRSSR